MSPPTRSLLLIATCLLAPLACQGKGEHGPSGADAAPAASFPAIYGKTLDGEYLHIQDLQARAVLVNVWATWCGPCRQELPTLQKLHETHQGQGLAILGVSIDSARDRDAVARMVQEHGLTYPILLDPKSRATTVLKVSGYPTSILFDGAGRQVWRRDGMILERDPDLASQLAALLSPPEGAPAPPRG